MDKLAPDRPPSYLTRLHRICYLPILTTISTDKMNRNNYRGSLSSHVEPDGCLESRIPTLGLHMDAVDGPSSKDVCISGPVDSGISSMGELFYHSMNLYLISILC